MQISTYSGFHLYEVQRVQGAVPPAWGWNPYTPYYIEVQTTINRAILSKTQSTEKAEQCGFIIAEEKITVVVSGSSGAVGELPSRVLGSTTFSLTTMKPPCLQQIGCAGNLIHDPYSTK